MNVHQKNLLCAECSLPLTVDKISAYGLIEFTCIHLHCNFELYFMREKGKTLHLSFGMGDLAIACYYKMPERSYCIMVGDRPKGRLGISMHFDNESVYRKLSVQEKNLLFPEGWWNNIPGVVETIMNKNLLEVKLEIEKHPKPIELLNEILK